MQSIFESLENLNVSEKCFNDIMDMVEEIVTGHGDNFEPAQDRRDRNKWKVWDKTACVYYDCKGGKRGAYKEAKRLNTVIPKKPEIDLNYESLDCNKLMDILEEVINELNKYEQYKINKNPELKKEIKNRQEALEEIGKMRNQEENPYLASQAVDILADENREALKRNDNIGISKISIAQPSRHTKLDKTFSGQKKVRTEQSQRGSSKDVWRRMDPLLNKWRSKKLSKGEEID